MAGRRPLPISDYPDDCQVLVLGPFDAADLLEAGTVIWCPDRRVIIDKVTCWFGTAPSPSSSSSSSSTSSAADEGAELCWLQLWRGVGPIGGTGGDASIPAAIAAGRDVTEAYELSAQSANQPFSLTIAEDANDQADNNLIDGEGYEDTSGNAIYDVLIADIDNSSASLDNLYVQVRYRSKIN